MNAKIDVTGVVLKTQRLVLREWKETDLDDFFEYARVDGVGQMAGWAPHKDKEESSRILKMFIEQKKTFCIEYNGKAIGSLGIEEYGEDYIKEIEEFKTLKGRELGYVLSKDYWGQGLMTEAVAEAIRYLFEDVGLDFITCCYFLHNKKSARVQEKSGFKFLKNIEYETRLGTMEKSAFNILKKSEYEIQKNK